MPILWIAKRDGRAVVIPVSNLGGSEFHSRPGDGRDFHDTGTGRCNRRRCCCVRVFQWVPGMKKLGLQADHLPPSSPETVNEWSSTCMPSYRAVHLGRGGHRLWEPFFSELFRFFSIKSLSTSAPPYQLVSEVGIGRIRGLTVPQGHGRISRGE
jgi:hypothetical protein